MNPEEVVRNYQNKYLLSSPMYSDFAGGLNLRVSPPEMAVNQSLIAENCIYNVASGAISARDGSVRANDAIVPTKLNDVPLGFFHVAFSGGSYFIAVFGCKNAGTLADPHRYRVFFAAASSTSSSWTEVAGLPSNPLLPSSRRVSGILFNDAFLIFDGVNEPYALTLSGGGLVYSPIVSSGAPAHLKACEFSAVYNNRVYVAGSSSAGVSFSDELASGATTGVLPVFTSTNQVFPGGPTDGDPIMGLSVAYGHLIIFKRNSIYALSDSSGSPSITSISRGVGLLVKHAVCPVDNSVWFFGPSGLYSLASDLTPEFQSDFVLPAYQRVLGALAIDTSPFNGTMGTNHPVLVYNQEKQQIWCACFDPAYHQTDCADQLPAYIATNVSMHNCVYIHDVINKDASGRPAVSVYRFFLSHFVRPYAVNYNPYLMVQGIASDGRPRVYSLNISSDAVGVAYTPYSTFPCYAMLHDVPLSETAIGDDGNSVLWRWQSKFFNLGDPLRLKALRYYSIFGDIRDDAVQGYSNQFTSYTCGKLVKTSRPYKYEVFPVSLKGATAVHYGSGVLVFGGVGSDGALSRDIYHMDLSASPRAWVKLAAQMPSGGHAYGAAVNNGTDGKVYIFGGQTGAASQVSSIYTFVLADLLSGAQTAPVILANTMVRVRAHHSAAIDAANQKVYIFGCTGVSPTSSTIFECFDIATATCTAKTAPTLRANCAGSTMFNYLFPSYGLNYFYLFLGSLMQIYDPSTDTWSAGSAPADRTDATYCGVVTYLSDIGPCFALYGGEEYSATGADGDPVDEVWHYGYGGWHISRSLPSPMSRMAWCDQHNLGNGYYAGGRPLPIQATFIGSDNFTTTRSQDSDVTLNTRAIAPATVNFPSRFWSILFEGRINDGFSRLTGFNLDYIMFQRRN